MLLFWRKIQVNQPLAFIFHDCQFSCPLFPKYEQKYLALAKRYEDTKISFWDFLTFTFGTIDSFLFDLDRIRVYCAVCSASINQLSKADNRLWEVTILLYILWHKPIKLAGSQNRTLLYSRESRVSRNTQKEFGCYIWL